MRTQFPILHFQEIMLFSMKALLPMTVLPTMVQSRSRAPFLMVQLGPITTFGPILQPYSTTELASIITLPVDSLSVLIL